MNNKTKIILVFSLLIVLALASYFLFIGKKRKNFDQRFLGKWENIFVTKNKKFRVVTYFSEDSITKNLKLKVYIPKIYPAFINPDYLNVTGDSLSFSIRKLRIQYNGKLLSDSSMIKGKMEFGNLGQKFNFLTEEKFIKSIRPQYPLKPYPYFTKEITIYSSIDSTMISGTLTRPKLLKHYPTIILATGMGPQDRDETMYGHKPFLVLADYFTKQGFAVFRYDDRGMGKSKGNYFTANTDIFAQDLIDCFKFLKDLDYVDSSKIGVIGFNEGGLIGALAANKIPDMAFLVLMSTPGLPASEILLDQTKIMQKKMGRSETEIDYDYKIDKQIYNILETVQDSAKAAQELKGIFQKFKKTLPNNMAGKWKYSSKVFKKKLRFLLSSWFRYYVKIVPSKIFKKVKCPTLVLFGGKDIQIIPKKNLMAIKSAFKKGGNKKVTMEIFPNLNHIFQDCNSGLPYEYSKIEETISPKAMEKILDWLNSVLKGREQNSKNI